MHVQLQHVQLELAEHIQGGIAAAEIVHLYGKAKVSQLIHGTDDLLRVFRVGAFRNFQVQQLGIDPPFPNDLPKYVRQIRLIDVRPGHVDGNR